MNFQKFKTQSCSPNLNRATCSVTRYQPFIFDTIGNSDCIFQKSLCNSLGQETYQNGNTTVDRKCICNTDKGYAFVRNSQNQCYCNPSTDDCSCHLGISQHNKTIGLNEAINHLPEEDKIRFNKLLQTEKTENRYFIRIMIVGKESTGKTCLLRRLLKKSISGVTSTDGVDIVVRRCKINIKDGTWIIGKDINNDKVGRIKRALSPNAEDRDTQNMQVDEAKNLNMSQRDEMPTNEEDIATDGKVSQDKSKDINESSSSLVTPENLTTDAKAILHKTEDTHDSSSLVMHDDSKTLTKDKKEFYATHQAFLTSSAVYLVVADMKDDIRKQELSQCFADFQNVGEYVEFWFDSIHCHRKGDERATNGYFHPPILLVFTGKDKYDKGKGIPDRAKINTNQDDQNPKGDDIELCKED
ncbi:unnamed protein product [Mytilus coruscus]|uniref:Roc domain-containing protein n=1 Tax=Mytilus coruscus TaxID=42192 RepID=A0A6J8EPM7_MYTCO|nr:unnamed protein product [Mytilus coruscus]